MTNDQPRLLHILLIIFASVFLAGLAPFLIQNSAKSLHILLGETFLALPALLYIKLKGFEFTKTFRLQPIKPKVLLSCIVLGLAVPVLNDELDRIIAKFIEMPADQEAFFTGLLRAQGWLDWIILFTGVVIVAGFAEEMLFRGLLQQALERRGNYLQAIILSSLVFAMIHPPQWFLQIIIMSGLLGFISWRANSILPGVILHACNNAFALLQVNIEEGSLVWYEWYGHVNPTIIAIGACAVFYSLKWFLIFNSSAENHGE